MVALRHVAVLVSSPVPFLSLPDAYTASKFMIDTGAGVIDADYRGTVFVLLFNHSDTDFEGMRSACLANVTL